MNGMGDLSSLQKASVAEKSKLLPPRAIGHNTVARPDKGMKLALSRTALLRGSSASQKHTTSRDRRVVVWNLKQLSAANPLFCAAL
jgi:hypothetical protein